MPCAITQESSSVLLQSTQDKLAALKGSVLESVARKEAARSSIVKMQDEINAQMKVRCGRHLFATLPYADLSCAELLRPRQDVGLLEAQARELRAKNETVCGFDHDFLLKIHMAISGSMDAVFMLYPSRLVEVNLAPLG